MGNTKTSVEIHRKVAKYSTRRLAKDIAEIAMSNLKDHIKYQIYWEYLNEYYKEGR